MGLFLTEKTPKGTIIELDYDERCGGFNHSCLPNAKLTTNTLTYGEITLLRDLDKDEEVTLGYVISGPCRCPSCRRS